MIETIKKLFGMGGQKADLGELLANGAIIIDVRTTGEYAGGHLNRSVNIPLNNLQGQMGKLKKDTPIITCCASGMRSSSARATLLSAGFKEVHNGGSWSNLKRYDK
ncbi:sulfurtransferase [Flavipsychrobacter stenotrophus]|uniref:Sulfurtransferase n=1 Tax=Flavipsychrobacter stenotrophus TaxID=2077091 RepID=A0A2S7SZR5_9BACT|nr:rhodanese-like domain-containing protein [Flavipsychrobacter stenotrophus]PQJ12006.1 sulfurtransferase [Flavipsychrobacter stenotrophus]